MVVCPCPECGQLPVFGEEASELEQSRHQIHKLIREQTIRSQRLGVYAGVARAAESWMANSGSDMEWVYRRKLRKAVKDMPGDLQDIHKNPAYWWNRDEINCSKKDLDEWHKSIGYTPEEGGSHG